MCGWVYGTLVFLLAAVVYWNALGCGFVFDDISAIKENRDLRPHAPIGSLFLHDFWGTPMQKVSRMGGRGGWMVGLGGVGGRWVVCGGLFEKKR